MCDKTSVEVGIYNALFGSTFITILLGFAIGVVTYEAYHTTWYTCTAWEATWQYIILTGIVAALFVASGIWCIVEWVKDIRKRRK